MGCHQQSDQKHRHHSRRACIFCMFVCAICSVNVQVCRGHQLPAVQRINDRLSDIKEYSSLVISDVHSHNSGGKTKRDAAEKTDVMPTLDVKNNYTMEILLKLLRKYGNGNAITFEGFEHLLENLGLADMIIDHSGEDHASWNKDLHANHQHHKMLNIESAVPASAKDVHGEIESSKPIQNKSVEEIETLHLDGMRNETSYVSSECLTPVDLLHRHQLNTSSVLSMQDFVTLCPSLVYQLVIHSCETHIDVHDRHSLVDNADHAHDADHAPDADHAHDADHSVWQAPSAQVWGYSLLACLVISAVGLVCVCIIPIMHKVIYNHMLQFLVALAIGSMTGDALLHLLPHAFIPHRSHGGRVNHTGEGHEEHGDHRHAVWVGLTAIGGIYMFFLVEQIVKICSERRHASLTHDVHEQNVPVQPIRLDSIPMLQSDGNNHYTKPAPSKEVKHDTRARLTKQEGASSSCEDTMMTVHSNKDVRTLVNSAHEEVHRNCNPIKDEDAWRRGHSSNGHNHSHTVPDSVASVAWMVIVGDGFHNFADGLAIGSAFASSLTGGLSTSIAVLCHELPHELGDFAMLMNAGMSAKQALIYNCVSSVLCLLGMIIGVTVGNLQSADTWIFAVIAGLFLYIALVDMLPEMKSVRPKTGEHPFVHLGLQNLGMITGGAIMLLIALFEDQIIVV